MIDENLLHASAAINELDAIHSKFVDFIRSIDNKDTELGFIDTTPDPISMACLHKTMKISRRIIAIDGRPTSNEYTVHANDNENMVLVSTFYLNVSGAIFSTPDESDSLCDYNDELLAEKLLTYTAQGLLKSQVFKPTEAG
jgi:hypothetical protein